MNALESSFAGPICLYQILQTRKESNPSFLYRNLPFKHDRKALSAEVKPNEIDLKLHFESLKNGVVSFHNIVVEQEPRTDALEFRAINLGSQEVRDECNVTRRIRPDTSESRQFLLVFFAKEPAYQGIDLHSRLAKSLCKRFHDFPFHDHPLKDIVIKLHSHVPALLLDLSLFLSRPKSAILEEITFLTFVHPLGQSPLHTSFSTIMHSNMHNNTQAKTEFSVSVCASNPSFQSSSSSMSSTQASQSSSLGDTCSRKRSRVWSDNSNSLIVHYTTEKRTEESSIWRDSFQSFQCPWCSAMKHTHTPICFANNTLSNVSMDALKAMLAHIHACHDHFSIEVVLSPEERHVHLIVQRRNVELDAHEPPDCEIRYPLPQRSHNLRSSGTDFNAYYFSSNTSSPCASPSPASPVGSSSSSAENQNFFLPATGQNLRPQDALITDADIDLSHELHAHNVLVDEYVDLSRQEKELMKLWNKHISSSPSLGDRYILVTCESFVRHFGYEVVCKGLRQNLLLHFMAMWDFGLLLSEEVERLMEIVDHMIVTQFSPDTMR